MTLRNLHTALEIFLKYAPSRHIAAEHDVLYLVDWGEVSPSDDDKNRLNQLGVWLDEESGAWACWT